MRNTHVHKTYVTKKGDKNQEVIKLRLVQGIYKISEIKN